MGKILNKKQMTEEDIKLHYITPSIMRRCEIERDTSYAREQVYNIINSRYLKGRPTIFTTNLSLEIIQNPNIELEYQRIYSRILEMTIPVKVTGEDFRRKIHQEKLRKYKELLLYGGGIDD